MKPMFKYLGGKTRILKEYERLGVFPDNCKNFYDLFSGGGSVAIWAYNRYPEAKVFINEINKHIIGLYTTFRDDYENFMEEFEYLSKRYLALPMQEEYAVKGQRHNRLRYKMYYSVREELLLLGEEGAYDYRYYARQFFLQKLSFGGVWQTTKEMKGHYATPCGYLLEEEIYFTKTKESLSEFYSFITDERVILSSEPYDRVDIKHGEGTVIYCDPPYINTNQKYGAKFDIEMSVKLCEDMNSWGELGSKVLMSNSQWDGWANLIPENFNLTEVSHSYTIHAQRSKGINEVIIHN